MIKYLTTDGEIIEEKYKEHRMLINLSHKKIKQIIKTEELNNIIILWLNGNQISDIKELEGITSLQELSLSDNRITEIKGLDRLTSLENLWLNHNQITEMKGLDGLISLQNLRLNDNQIKEMKGLDGLTSLQYLSLENNQITKIKGLNGLTSLQELTLYDNRITKIEGLDGLTSLQQLMLDNNKITEIKGLDGLTSLQRLMLDNNKITEIKGLDGLTSLQELSLYGNRITKIKGLSGLISLQQVSLENNQIEEINGLDGLTSLQKLGLSGNRITEINGLDGLTNLRQLLLDNNKITKIPFSIMNNRKLNTLDIDCKIDPIIQRFLDRNIIKDQKTIYDDSQNVHDSHIAKSIKQSIFNIIDESTTGKPCDSTTGYFQSKEISIDLILKNIISDKTLNETTKQQLVEYCQDKTVHSILNLTFEEVLCSVWKIISEHKESNEIKKILNEEMKDSMCKCFTGRLSRLVNCLNGFDSRVSIKINDKEQILNVIIKIRNKYSDDISKQKEEVIKELLERGYDKNTINEYIIYLE
jgi:Leucine-rich repeat (LRR) protein